MREKENLSWRLNQLSSEMLSIAQDMIKIYDKDFEHCKELIGAANIAKEWADEIKKENKK